MELCDMGLSADHPSAQRTESADAREVSSIPLKSVARSNICSDWYPLSAGCRTCASGSSISSRIALHTRDTQRRLLYAFFFPYVNFLPAHVGRNRREYLVPKQCIPGVADKQHTDSGNQEETR
ncbi:hypothetical protein GJ744_006526 [Endocarpon pusillum]|uniref:Uncharacterized protein n=1 Tax=Endocarpon pusillum TaxID=364733 RepID=A0A8H7E977_9EURO|nr:hypothetical protein GJ744_006526 [Endocarpon pusillum]